MAVYIILSKISSGMFRDPGEFPEVAREVADKIKEQCPGVTWKDSYATLGRFDGIDIVEADNPTEVEKAAMIMRGYGNATTETLLATPWKKFLKALEGDGTM